MIRYFLGAILCVAAFNVHAEKDFSSWRKFSQGSLIGETTALSPGTTGTIGLSITLAEGWHTYWVNPGDSGAAVQLTFRNSPGIRVRQVLLPTPKRYMTGPLVSFGYAKEVLFLIDVDVKSSVNLGSDAEFTVEAEWLVCEDVCIPAFDTLKLKVPVRPLEEVKPTGHFARFQKTRSEVPAVQTTHPEWEESDGKARLTVTNWSGREFVDFFPFKNAGVTAAPAVVEVKDGSLKLTMEKSTVPRANPDRVGVLVSRNTQTGQLESWQYGESGWKFDEPGRSSQQSIWWMLLSAFLGGLVLNLMPCVFPILSIKLLSLLKISASHVGEVRRQNFAYVAGVLCSFVLIALLLSALRSAGQLVGWGFQLQSPVFLSVLSWLFFALSLNLLGVFELDFLNSGLGGRLTKLGGIWGSFFTGVLAVVVASPCTAPFMGAALGFGLTQPVPVLVAIFTALGLGLAFPYLIFGIFPRAIRVLPRPGRWMNTVKQVMAFPMLLTTLWLLWVLGQVRGTNALMVVLAGCVVLGFAFWLSAWRKRAATILAAVVLTGGLFYVYRGEQQMQSHVESDVWKPYSDSMLESLKGRAVFVNMTADWCLTCKVNERLVFNDADVMALMAAKNVVLVKGDWTSRNEEITRFLSRFERVGVPFYVLYSPQHPDGQILPEVLTKSTFMDLIQKEFP